MNKKFGGVVAAAAAAILAVPGTANAQSYNFQTYGSTATWHCWAIPPVSSSGQSTYTTSTGPMYFQACISVNGLSYQPIIKATYNGCAQGSDGYDLYAITGHVYSNANNVHSATLTSGNDLICALSVAYFGDTATGFSGEYVQAQGWVSITNTDTSAVVENTQSLFSPSVKL